MYLIRPKNMNSSIPQEPLKTNSAPSTIMPSSSADQRPAQTTEMCQYSLGPHQAIRLLTSSGHANWNVIQRHIIVDGPHMTTTSPPTTTQAATPIATPLTTNVPHVPTIAKPIPSQPRPLRQRRWSYPTSAPLPRTPNSCSTRQQTMLSIKSHRPVSHPYNLRSGAIPITPRMINWMNHVSTPTVPRQLKKSAQPLGQDQTPTLSPTSQPSKKIVTTSALNQ